MSEMRRSCNFCRQRRMRCNGELPWCGACHERSTPCVYEAVGARGRPRRQDSSDKLNSSPTQGATLSLSDDGSLDGKGNPSIGDYLMSIVRQVWPSLQQNEGAHHCLQLPTSDSEDCLVVLLEQLVHLATGKAIGEMQTATIQDISSMEDIHMSSRISPKEESKEQTALTPAQVMQLMELAFCLHPFLSLIVSKTSLLYDHRDGLAFTPLLLVVAAEGLDLGLPRSEPLFKEAALLSSKELVERAESELKRGRYNSTMSCHGMAMCQTLLLLTFRMLNCSQVSRAAVHLSLCTQMLDSIWEKRCSETCAEVKMNGVQMANVEEELLCNLTWITSSFSMWISLQIPNLSVILQSSKYRLDFNQLPIMDILNRSNIYQLDYMSGNLSVLKSQEKNGRILCSLASVHCYVEQYLCETASSATLSLDSHFAHSDKEAEILVATVSSFLGLKSCLMSPSSSSSSSNSIIPKLVIQPSHIHVILTIAGKTVEAAAKTSNSTITRPSCFSSIQSATVGLQVDTISNLAVAFELLFAFTLPIAARNNQHEIVINSYFEKFEMDSSSFEMIESNKWQMMMTLQSFGIILNQESMSCHQRMNVKKQVDELSAIVQNVLITNEVDLPPTSTSSSTNTTTSTNSQNTNTSNNLFAVGGPSHTSGHHQHTLSLATPTQPHHPRRFSQHYTYDNHPQFHQAHPSPVSPRYFSVPFSDINDISSHPIFNPFQQASTLTTPTSRTFGHSSMMFYHDDVADIHHNTNRLSPTDNNNNKFSSESFDGPSAPSAHALSLHPQRRRSRTFSSAFKTEASLIHYGSDQILSNSPYPSDFLHSDYRSS